METTKKVSQEIDDYIMTAGDGNARDALNVALYQLGQARIELNELKTQVRNLSIALSDDHVI